MSLFEIFKPKVKNVILNDFTTEYNGDTHSLKISGDIPSDVKVTYENNSHRDSGLYHVKAILTGKRYKKTELNATLKINKRNFDDVVFDDQEFVYDGDVKRLIIKDNLPVETKVEYSNNNQTNVGSYLVKVLIKNKNYNSKTLTANLNITPAPILGIKVSSLKLMFNNRYHSLKIDGTLPPEAEVSYENNNHIYPGVYDVTTTINAPNYIPLKIYAKLEILENIKFESKEVEYDGVGHSLVLDDPYKVTKVEYDQSQVKEIGNYIISARLLYPNGYTSIHHAELTILPKKMIRNIFFNDETLEYDGHVHSLSVEGNLPLHASVSYVNNHHIDVGNHKVKAIITAENTLPLEMEAILSIEKSTIKDIKLESKSVKFNGEIHFLKVTGHIKDDIKIEYVNNGHNKAGEYEVIAVATSPNHHSLYLSAILTIEHLEFPKITVKNKFIYDGTPKMIEVTNDLPEDTKIVFSLDPQSKIGTYQVKVIFEKENYKRVSIKESLSIVSEYETKLLNEKLKITKYNGEVKHVIVPHEIDSKIVNHIGVNAFSGHDEIVSVELPNHLEVIDELAFSDCVNLLFLKFPSSLKRIEKKAFSGCSKLREVFLDSSVEYVGSEAFSSSSFTKVYVNGDNSSKWDMEWNKFSKNNELKVLGYLNVEWNSKKKLNSSMFEYKRTVNKDIIITSYNKFNYEDVMIPKTIDGLKVIGIESNTFSNHDEIEEIYIHEDVINVGVDIFSNIDNITIHLEHKEIPDSWQLNWAWSNYDDYSLNRVIILNSNKSYLLHNYTDIYSINDDQLKIEQLHLNSITEIIRKDIRQKQHLHEERLENYPMGMINPTVIDFRKTQRNELIHKHNSQVKKLKKIYENPYFLRIDIISNKKYKRYYVGEADYSSFVIDWRSDIGRLYRNKKFTIKLDKREFQVSLIRRYKIENREILEVDNEFVKDSITAKNKINDPFLQKILREKRNKGELTNIISSIQIKQNEIIDYGIGNNFDGNFIVQGCAGSGKTMILLHRIANIIYNFQGFDIHKACIITPNKHFNTYINELTVDLGIDKISRKTIEEYYFDLINKAQSKENSKLNKFTLEHTSDRFDFNTQKLVQSSDFLSFIKQKCDEVKLFHKYYILNVEIEYLSSNIEKNISQVNDFLNNNQGILDRNKAKIKLFVKEISNSYQKICESKKNNFKLSIGIRRDLLVLEEIKHLYERLPVGIIFNEEDIFNQRRVNGWDDFDKHYKINQSLVRFKESGRIEEYEDKSLLILIIDFFKNVADLIEHLKNDSKRREELNRLQETIKEDEKRLKIKQRDIGILRSKHVNITINELYKELNVSSTITKIFDNVIIDWNKTHENQIIDHSLNNRDTLYIKTYMVHQCLGFMDDSYKYLFVDEGQDIAKHEYDLLNKICNNKIVFNIYGDLYQKVPTIYGIDEWKELEMPLFYLSENYRNGMEIVDFYNTELEFEDLAFGLDAKVGKTTDIINDLLKFSDNDRESNRIAFLSNDKKFIKKISEMLEEKTIVGDTKKGLISLMSIVQVKGLEFDIVYVDRDKLTKNEKYIAYSRAIKELYIVDS